MFFSESQMISLYNNCCIFTHAYTNTVSIPLPLIDIRTYVHAHTYTHMHAHTRMPYNAPSPTT